jgi:hypothetical protein
MSMADFIWVDFIAYVHRLSSRQRKALALPLIEETNLKFELYIPLHKASWVGLVGECLHVRVRVDVSGRVWTCGRCVLGRGRVLIRGRVTSYIRVAVHVWVCASTRGCGGRAELSTAMQILSRWRSNAKSCVATDQSHRRVTCLCTALVPVHRPLAHRRW